MVDTTTVVVHEHGEGSPFASMPQDLVEQKGWEDLSRMVREYDPSRELVAVLLKAGERRSAYRLGTPRQ
ncbi:MAG: hypothetical protein H5T69_15250 [Chloroflexi bacterium]|nr:hypothetical protein [Chloroflexota bacterium]